MGNSSQLGNLYLSENKIQTLKQVIWRSKSKAKLPKEIRISHFADYREAPESIYMNQMEDIIAKADTDDGVNIQFTSGTTGNPKGAFLSHHGILNNAYQVRVIQSIYILLYIVGHI